MTLRVKLTVFVKATATTTNRHETMSRKNILFPHNSDVNVIIQKALITLSKSFFFVDFNFQGC